MSMTQVEMERALKQLRLSGIRATLETRALQSQASSLSFLDTFALLIQDELDRRRSRLIERRFKLSGLDERKTLEDFDWAYNPKIPKRACFELLTLKFLNEAQDPILIGPPGTGKSHMGKAVAHAAVLEGYHVLYAEAEELFAKIGTATLAGNRRKLLQQIIDSDLLVIDDLFLQRRFPEEAADSLQEVLHKRYKLRRSTLITSNRVISDWGKYLGDNAMASTLLDRLMHRGLLLEFQGKSYRLREALARLAQAKGAG